MCILLLRFLELLQLAPSDWRVMYNLGALYVDTSQYDKAERWFKKTLEVVTCRSSQYDNYFMYTG